MDLFNNNVGREVFTSVNPNILNHTYVVNMIIALLNNGQLVYIKNGIITISNQ